MISNMGSDGIGHSASGAEMIVLDAIVRDNLGAGIILVAANASIVIDRVRSEHNQFDGLYLAPTPGSSGANATIGDSVFTHNGLHGIRAETVGGATASVQVERSILSNNVGNGFRALVGAAAGARVNATLTRNAISRNSGNGVLLTAVSPGSAIGVLVDNSVHHNAGNGIYAFGSGVQIRVGGNAVQYSGSAVGLECENGATLVSYGNNMVADGIQSPGGCYITVSGD